MLALSGDHEGFSEIWNAKIQIVDDNEDFADSMAELLEAEGYDVATAYDGKQAEDLVDSFRPDVVFVDRMLGAEDGVELIERLRSSYPELLCVIVTAYPETDSVIGALRHGAYDYLKKPVKDNDIFAVIRRSAERRQLEQQKRQAETETRESEARLRTLLEASPIAYTVVDAESDQIVFVNEKTAEICGISVEQLLDQPLSKFIADREQREGILDEVARHKFIQRREVVIENADGQDVWLLVNVSIVEFEGRSSIVVAGVDISEIKRAQEEIRQLNTYLESRVQARTLELTDEIAVREKTEQALRVAKDFAEAANGAKSAFLANMSHELRTPLNAVIGFGQLLKENIGGAGLTERQDDYVSQILTAGSHLLALIDEVLDLTQVESGKLSLTLEPVNLTEIVEECRGLIEPSAVKRSINIIDETAGVISPDLVGDRVRLKQVVANILSNAVKYNVDNGSVRIFYERLEPSTVRLRVEDTGIGIPEEDLPTIFDPFVRVDPFEADIEGTGIGLAITKSLIELMDGHVGAESTVGEGSAFWIELPVEAPTG